jgi:hypothetical protein
LLHAAIHAYPERGGGEGAGLECLHHADIVDGSLVLVSHFSGDRLEHSPVHIVLELPVELLQSPLLPILLMHPLACP